MLIFFSSPPSVHTKVIQIFLKYATVVKRQDIMEQLTAEREHFLESLHVLLKELKPFLSENHNCPDDIEISAVCWETKRLKLFHNEVGGIVTYGIL